MTNPTNRSNLKQEYVAELKELENNPPIGVQISPIAIVAIVGNIQLASRHPDVTDSPVTKIAIDAARQLQKAFNPKTAIYRVMELGWNPDEDLPVPEDETSDDCSEEDEPSLYILENHIDSVYKGFHRESFDDYIGEAPLDRFEDPEEQRATYKDNFLYDDC